MDVSYILIILLLGSLATYFAGNKNAAYVALGTSVVAFIMTLVAVNQHLDGVVLDKNFLWIASPKTYFALSADGLALAMMLLTTALIPIIIFTTFGNVVTNAKAFYGLIMFMAFSMSGTFLAADGLLYYVFWELSLIPIYFIALIWGNGDAEVRKKAVIKFFIYTFAGSLFMLVAFAYLYFRTGSFLIIDLSRAMLTADEQFYIFFAFFLAYAVKIPLIPFHTWQASVYQKAPAVGTMLLAGIMLKMGLYSVIRWQVQIAPLAAEKYMDLLIGISVAGVIYGSIVALRQTDLKRLLAYSSLAHVGLIAAGCYTLTADGLTGAVMQMIAHGFVIVGLFFVAEIIFRRLQTREIAQMGGIRIQSPKFTSMFLILVLASVALPGTFNFVGEFMVLYSLSQIDLIYAILGGMTIILGAYYMLRMFQNVMLGEKNATIFADVTAKEATTLVAIIGVLLFFGLYPKPLTDLIQPSIENILANINRFQPLR